MTGRKRNRLRKRKLRKIVIEQQKNIDNTKSVDNDVIMYSFPLVLENLAPSGKTDLSRLYFF
jgi:hypothetical protein